MTLRFMFSGLSSPVERIHITCWRTISSPSCTGSAVFKVIGPAEATEGAINAKMSAQGRRGSNRFFMAIFSSLLVLDLDLSRRESGILDGLLHLRLRDPPRRRLEGGPARLEIDPHIPRAGERPELLLDAVGAEGAGHPVAVDLDLVRRARRRRRRLVPARCRDRLVEREH